MAKVKARLSLALRVRVFYFNASAIGIATRPFVTSVRKGGLRRSGQFEAILRGIPRAARHRPDGAHGQGRRHSGAQHPGARKPTKRRFCSTHTHARPPAHAIRPHAPLDRRQPRRQNRPPTWGARPTPPHKQAGAEHSTLRDATAGATTGYRRRSNELTPVFCTHRAAKTDLNGRGSVKRRFLTEFGLSRSDTLRNLRKTLPYALRRT